MAKLKEYSSDISLTAHVVYMTLRYVSHKTISFYFNYTSVRLKNPEGFLYRFCSFQLFNRQKSKAAERCNKESERQRPVLGIKWCPEAGGATVGGLEGSALAGIWTAGVPSNKRDNVGASNTHTQIQR